MPRLVHDGALGGTGARRGRRMACSQAMAGVLGCVQPGTLHQLFDDAGHLSRRQAFWLYLSVAIDRSEYRAVRNGRLLQPGLNCANRACFGIRAVGYSDLAPSPLL